MKKVLIVFSAVMLLASFSVAFADGDAANLFKTYCQGCHGADGSRVPAKGIPPSNRARAPPICSRNLKDTRTAPLAPNASSLWKTSSSNFRANN